MNGTGWEPGRPSPASNGARGPSLHVTFGVETALSGTYESLLHHALEIAAAEHPQLFGRPPSQGETETETKTVSAVCVRLMFALRAPPVIQGRFCFADHAGPTYVCADVLWAPWKHTKMPTFAYIYIF